MSDPNSNVTYRDIAGFPGYRVGDDGSVWSLWQKSQRESGRGFTSKIGLVWRRLALRVNSGGYQIVTLCPGHHSRSVHALVLTAFKGACPANHECRHLDGDGTNNRLVNLQWGTRLENREDRVRHGTETCGEKHPSAKLTAESVRKIREASASGKRRKDLAILFGVSVHTIKRVVGRSMWKHVS